MKKTLSFILCAALFLISCNRVDYYQADSYVGRYEDLTKITLARNGEGALCIDVKSDFEALGFYRPGDEKYRDLCRKHGDVGYNRKIAYLSARSVVYNASDLLSVKVYSDRDFDERHPAGSSLADIVRFLSCSPKEYIASGYKSLYRYDPELVSPGFRSTWGYYYHHQDKVTSEYHPVDKMLCDIVPEDLVLLGPDNTYWPQSYFRFFSLFFEKMPAVKEDHVITVELTTDDGRVLSGSITMDFAEYA